MKNLKKIPREINAKFCYLEFADHDNSEDIKPVEKKDINLEDLANKYKSPKKTDAEIKYEEERENPISDAEIEAAYADNVNVKINLKDSALVNDDVVKEDLAADVPGGLFRRFVSQNSDFQKNAIDGPKDMIASLENPQKEDQTRMESLFGSKKDREEINDLLESMNF